MNAAVMTLAHYYARRDVKENIRRMKGSTALRTLTVSELSQLAKAWLDVHPELIEQAAETVRNDPKFRTLAGRAERWRKQMQLRARARQ